MSDVLIIGGGVIGLTAAYELSQVGVDVTVVDQSRVGEEASWAGAGMLPPALLHGPPELQQLQRVSADRWPVLTQQLREETGLDNGYRVCGAIQIDFVDQARLEREAGNYRAQNIPCEVGASTGPSAWEPALNSEIMHGYRLPTMSQVRNPWHLRTLRIACEQRGVRFVEGLPIHEFKRSGTRVDAAISPLRWLPARKFLITAGAWTTQILKSAGCVGELEIVPVRGQIALLRCRDRLVRHIIESGAMYLVPRDDGRVLIGSTMENVGFVKENTAAGVRQLLSFAVKVCPELAEATIERTWSGLRPKAVREVPYIGRVPGADNLFVAAGHFRDGLSQSPATALLLRELLTDHPPSIDHKAFGT